ncbi:MAG TPA: class I tRNA ligase family protein, partial [Planctomycetaceae bacterium]|nr:class I tRNA ligase family protein [Planctomycetaceae bacterium]
GEYEGIDRYKARDLVVEKMQELGHLVDVEERVIPLAHSDRSKTPVEPYLSDQWFVRMEDLAQNAIDAVNDRRVRFFPGRYAKTYLDWLGEKRDWCISRQLWWGHRIPIWYCATCAEADLKRAFAGRSDVAWRHDPETNQWLICSETDLPANALGPGHSLKQDDDVLDTWFSSSLWPEATLGWPEKTASLAYFYPTSVLVTSRDIITLWVARMVIMGLYNMKEVPFAHVFVHPKLLDGFGQTMSKSRGNGVDPLDLFEKFGTDAVRFTIASFAGETQDVRLPVSYVCPHCEALIPQTLEHQKAAPRGGAKPRITCPKCKKSSQYSSPWYEPDPREPVARIVSERFEYGRNFCNKLWNAARFVALNLEGYTPGAISPDELKLEDRWILSRLSYVSAELTEQLDRYQLDGATRTLRDFVWNEFCDWYVEMVKPRLRDESLRQVAQRVLVGVLDTILRMLQPLAPFLCEELWQRLAEIAPERGIPSPSRAAASVMVAPWPVIPTDWRDPALEARFSRLQDTIVAVRNVRAVYGIPPATPLTLHVRCTPQIAGDLQDVSGQFENLARTMLEAAGAEVERPKGSASFALTDADGFIPLEGVIDRDAELKRQRKEKEKLSGIIAGSEKKLADEKFVSRAPAEVVAQARENLASLHKQLQSVEEIIRQLSTD